jgi:hypothetical protein
MAVHTQPKPAPIAFRRPELRVIEASPRKAQLHLLTFVVANALFWALWAAISVTAERWYWWPIIPFVGWAVVLAGHLRRAHRRGASPALRSTEGR